MQSIHFYNQLKFYFFTESLLFVFSCAKCIVFKIYFYCYSGAFSAPSTNYRHKFVQFNDFYLLIYTCAVDTAKWCIRKCLFLSNTHDEKLYVPKLHQQKLKKAISLVSYMQKKILKWLLQFYFYTKSFHLG